MEVSANEYRLSIGRVILDSELKPYKLVLKADFVNDIKLMIRRLGLVEVQNSIIMEVMNYVNNSQDIKKLGTEPNLFSYFNNEIEVANNRILYSFLIKDNQGYKDWINGKDIIWYTESEADKYDNV